MSWLDDIFGTSSTTPATPTPPAQPPQNFADMQRLMEAAAYAQFQNEHPLAGLFGIGKSRASALADAAAPGAYQTYQSNDTANKEAQLALLRNLAMSSGIGNTPLDPNNLMGSWAPFEAAARAAVNPAAQPNHDAQPHPGAQPNPGATPSAPQSPFGPLDAAFAQAGGVDPAVQQKVESNNDPNAISPKGAQGLMQVMNSTNWNPGYGVTPAQNGSPAERVRVGRDYSVALQQRFGPTGGLIAYNWGPTNYQNWLNNGANLAALPSESVNYVGKIAKAQNIGAQQGVSATPMAPGASPAPAAAGSLSDDSAAARQRQMLLRMATLSAFGGNMQGMSDFYKAANADRPDGATLNPANGEYNPTLIAGQTAQQYGAQGKQIDAAATQAGTNSQTPVQVITRNGPATITAAQQMQTPKVGPDGKPNYFLPTDPQYQAIRTSQDADMKAAQTNAQTASSTLDTAQQLWNAANKITTGTGAQSIQDMRKLGVGLLQQMGFNVDPSVANTASDFEKLNFASLQLVQSAAHSFSPRVALQVVRMIQAVKPGDKVTPLGIKKIIAQEIIPEAMKQQATVGAMQNYYQRNPLAQDGSAVVPNGLPLSQFGLKTDLNTVQPGDYFVDPASGNIRQRPAQ